MFAYRNNESGNRADKEEKRSEEMTHGEGLG